MGATLSDADTLQEQIVNPKRKRGGLFRKRLSDLIGLRRHQMVPKEVLDDLFLMERRTLITLMLVETILLYILLPLLGDGIFVWYGLILTVTLWRYYLGYRYLKVPETKELIVWHKKLVVLSWLTALLFAVLALWAMPMLEKYYQLFVVLILVGLGAGAVKTLAEDYRTAIGYLLILLFPLGVELLLLGRKESVILAFLLGIYLVTQVSILLRAHERSQELRRAKEILDEAKSQLFEKQELLQCFFEQASEGIFTYDREWRILDCNSAFLSMFHFRKEEVVGRKIEDLEDEDLVTILQAALTEGVGGFRNNYRSSQGREFWLEAKCSPLYNTEGRIIGGLGLIEDKTREHLSMEELRFLVSHDPLTTALNRRGFRTYMQELIRDKRHSRLPTLLFYLDMDRFKQVNDIYGHEAGDQLLVEIAKRLKKLLPEEGRLVRLGGDEFAIILPFVEEALKDPDRIISQWVKKIHAVFTTPVTLRNSEVKSACSIGVVIMQPGMEDIEEIIRSADISMFRAKELRENDEEGYVLYTPDMGAANRKLHQMHRELELALQEDQFRLHFQPIVRAKDHRLLSAEVLLRWQHPRQDRLLSPAEFLPVARQFNLISQIDMWVLDHACAQIASWKKDQGLNFLPFALSVNVDARLLLQESFPSKLARIFKKHGILSRELILEVTEDSLVENFNGARNVLDKLKSMGVECAIDDFGTGYSSLSYLKKLSFGILKVDREFVQDLLENPDYIRLLKTIIDMGKGLNYRIVIEGVENEEQMSVIKNIDMDVGCQGYLLSRPLGRDAFWRLVSRSLQRKAS